MILINTTTFIIVLHAHARFASRGHAHLAHLCLAQFACPNVFPFPIVSSSFLRLHEVSVRIQATDDDDNPVGALSIHSELSRAPCDSTAHYIPGICTSALHKDATNILEKTKHPHQWLGPCKHMFQV
jgi:hypothetical protein